MPELILGYANSWNFNYLDIFEALIAHIIIKFDITCSSKVCNDEKYTVHQCEL